MIVRLSELRQCPGSSVNRQIRSSPRHARKMLAGQIDLIYVLELISAEGLLPGQIGGAARSCAGRLRDGQ